MTAHRRQMPRLGTAAVVAMALASACAHGTLSPSGLGLAGSKLGKVAEVSVAIQPSMDADRLAVYDAFGGNDAIAAAITTRLEEGGLYDRAGDVRIAVTVTAFRLRSTANAFWNGFFAGIDKLEGRVDFVEGGAPPATYVFTLSGTEDIYFKYSAGARFRSLARELAEKLSDALTQRVA